jgi:hypothetical protein
MPKGFGTVWLTIARSRGRFGPLARGTAESAELWTVAAETKADGSDTLVAKD